MGFPKILRNCQSGSWQILTSNYKVGGWGEKMAKTCLGTIHLRRQHVFGGEGCSHVPMVKRSQYIRIKNPLHKHFAGMPMVGR